MNSLREAANQSVTLKNSQATWHALAAVTNTAHTQKKKKGQEGGGGNIEHGKECPNMKLWLIKESKKKKNYKKVPRGEVKEAASGEGNQITPGIRLS